MSNGEGGAGSKLNKVHFAVTILIAVFTALSSYRLQQADTRLKTVEAEVRARESERKDAELVRADRESLEKKEIIVYDAVVKSLETENSKRQRVAKALVTSLLDLDRPLRGELLAILVDSGTPEIKKEAQLVLEKENQFKEQERKVSAPAAAKSFNWEDVDFDIFWCEKSGEGAKKIAEQMRDQLLKQGAKGRVRARLLPDSINSRPGYQHAGYVIRYNKGEEKQAEQLAQVGKSAAGVAEFQRSLSRQETPWYLSAFVCPG